MAPKEDYLKVQEDVLKNLENSLVQNLNPEDRIKSIDQGKLLEQMQSEKETENELKCLPTLTINDIPMTLPKQEGVNEVTINGIKGMSLFHNIRNFQKNKLSVKIKSIQRDHRFVHFSRMFCLQLIAFV